MATNRSTAIRERVANANAALRSGQSGNTIYDLVERLKPELERALPAQIGVERFTRVAITTLRLNPNLAKCNPPSLLGALMLAAQLGLEPGTPLGHSYLVPYGNEVTFIIGWRGMIDLARRSGQVTNIFAHVVHEGDEFSYSLGLHPDLKHVPGENDDAAWTHVYAVAHVRDGEPVFVVLSRAGVYKFRDRSKAKNNGPWKTDEEAMALKTAVRRLFNWLPQSVEMASALAADERTISQPVSLDALDLAPAEAYTDATDSAQEDPGDGADRADPGSAQEEPEQQSLEGAGA